jgi:hypothetical protein
MTSRTGKMSVANSRAAYRREYRKRKSLEEDNCHNASKRKNLNAERQREYRKTHKNLPTDCNNLKITSTIAHKIKSSMSAC